MSEPRDDAAPALKQNPKSGTISHNSAKSQKSRTAPTPGQFSAVDRLRNWLTPYTKQGYPGKYRFWHIMTGLDYAPNTIKHWIIGAKPAPRAILLHWAELVDAKCKAGLEIAAALRTAAADTPTQGHAGAEALRRYRLKKRSTSTL